jgi:hypothetical protein
VVINVIIVNYIKLWVLDFCGRGCKVAACVWAYTMNVI